MKKPVPHRLGTQEMISLALELLIKVCFLLYYGVLYTSNTEWC